MVLGCVCVCVFSRKEQFSDDAFATAAAFPRANESVSISHSRPAWSATPFSARALQRDHWRAAYQSLPVWRQSNHQWVWITRNNANTYSSGIMWGSCKCQCVEIEYVCFIWPLNVAHFYLECTLQNSPSDINWETYTPIPANTETTHWCKSNNEWVKGLVAWGNHLYTLLFQCKS